MGSFFRILAAKRTKTPHAAILFENRKREHPVSEPQRIEMKQPSLIFLTGFSGSGKSTIGPLLANSLGFDFIDLDKAIETAANKSINRIFSEEGEAAFRQLELDTLESIVTRRDLVVSLGGGVLENDRCLELIRRHGTLVYLKSSPEVLTLRLQHKTDRPLLKAGDGSRLSREEIQGRIAALLARREPRYLKADLVIVTDSKKIGSTVEELTRKIERHIRKAARNNKKEK
jgi:shikimate kinase